MSPAVAARVKAVSGWPSTSGRFSCSQVYFWPKLLFHFGIRVLQVDATTVGPDEQRLLFAGDVAAQRRPRAISVGMK